MVIVVFTGRGPKRIIQDGGSQAWVLDPRRARQCDYVVCTQNKYASWDGADPSEGHRAAFLVGKIAGIVRTQERDEQNRFLIRISEYALLKPPVADVWDGGRNPVRYVDKLEDLQIDPSRLDFEPMPTATDGNSQGRKRLSLGQAKQALAATFGVRPEAVEIIIHG